jgi:hypothetical protein
VNAAASHGGIFIYVPFVPGATAAWLSGEERAVLTTLVQAMEKCHRDA